MAVRKKKSVKKKNVKKKGVKKKVVKKGTVKKSAKKAAKKSVKKSVKKATTKTKAATKTRTVKKKAEKKKAAIRSVKDKPTTSTISSASAGKGSRRTRGSLKIGAHVRVKGGRNAGESGTIVRQDTCLGTYLMTFDRCKKDPVYHNIEWGPYFASQLDNI